MASYSLYLWQQVFLSHEVKLLPLGVSLHRHSNCSFFLACEETLSAPAMADPPIRDLMQIVPIYSYFPKLVRYGGRYT
jgi:hypothetical protein